MLAKADGLQGLRARCVVIEPNETILCFPVLIEVVACYSESFAHYTYHGLRQLRYGRLVLFEAFPVNANHFRRAESIGRVSPNAKTTSTTCFGRHSARSRNDRVPSQSQHSFTYCVICILLLLPSFAQA